MFGYVKPFKPMLRVCEFDTYQAIYCGLCKQLSRSYGPFARLTLSYDFTFLSLFDLALQEESPKFERENCLYNPLKKKPCCIHCDSLHYGASCAMIMLYYKVLDNISDEGFFKRMMYRLALPVVRRARNKALENFSDVDRVIDVQMKKQALLEQNKCDRVDQAGEPTAECLGYLFARMARQEGQKRALHRFGYLLGRWIYMVDALDDVQKDLELNRYNPFILRSQAGESLDEVKKEAVLSLNMTIGEIIKTFQLLDLYRYHSILENVVDLGLKNMVIQVCGEKKKGRADDR